MIGIKDIARLAGVSPSTVSNALNGRANIGEETKKRVLEICTANNYYPNMYGKNLRNLELNNIILFNFSDFDRSFYLKIIKGINDYAQAQGYDLIISTNKSCERFMNPGYTSGCIMLDRRMQSETLLSKASMNYPIIALDRKINSPYIKSILVNNYDSMYKMVEELVNRGYRKYAFLGGVESTEDNLERYQAFKEALENHKIQFLQKNYISGDYNEKSGTRAAKILMLSGQLPDVLVCANDSMAIGAMKVFKENGIRVPEDVAVTGFDDIDIAASMGLTTISVPNYERGYLAAQYLIESMRGEGKYENFEVPSKIIWRSSVRKRKINK
jgi:LacI family transcriptional regulator